MTRTYDIAVIPGDGIGKEVVPEGMRVLERAAKKFGFELKQKWHDFASYDYYAKHERMMPEDWEERLSDQARDLFRRRRLARENPRPCFAVGLADPVPSQVRSVRQSAPGAADAGRCLAARQPQARRHRLLCRAREHRRRILLDRRAHVSGDRARIRRAGNGDDASRRRSRLEIRFRPRGGAGRRST